MRPRIRAVWVLVAVLLATACFVILLPPRPKQPFPRFLEPFRDRTTIKGPLGNGYNNTEIGLTTTYSIHAPPRKVVKNIVALLREGALEYGQSPGCLIIHDGPMQYQLDPGRLILGSDDEGKGWTTLRHDDIKQLTGFEQWVVRMPVPILDWRYGTTEPAKFKRDDDETYLSMWRAMRSRFYANLKRQRLKWQQQTR